jgi:hypothetical protein
MIKGLLKKGINVEVAINVFGIIKAKEFIGSPEAVQEIKKMKERLSHIEK